jgi:hypothetical protein
MAGQMPAIHGLAGASRKKFALPLNIAHALSYSEINLSQLDGQSNHLLQVWIDTDKTGNTPAAKLVCAHFRSPRFSARENSQKMNQIESSPMISIA